MFGILGIYVSVVHIISSISTLKYDQALILPKRKDDASILLCICFISLILTTILSFIIIFLWNGKLATIIKMQGHSYLIWVLPFSVLTSGTYISFTAWLTRERYFKRTSFSQILRSTSSSGLQCIVGMSAPSSFGLIGGIIFGDVIAALNTGIKSFKTECFAFIKSFSISKLIYQLKEYSDFPLYSSPQNLLNSISNNIPSLLLAQYFGTTVVGFYAIGIRAIQMPMNIITTALRQVLFQKASEVYNAGGDTYSLFLRATMSLLLLIALPTILFILLAPAIFSILFGSDWQIAGDYARWLVIWLAVAFANIPSILFAQIYRKQKLLFIQDIFLLLCRALALILGGLYLSALNTIICYSVVGIFFNTFIIIYMLFFLKLQRGISKQQVNKGMLFRNT